MPLHLENLAYVALGQGEPERAARLLGAAAALRAARWTPILPVDRPEHEDQVARTRAALGEPAFTAAWVAGRAMTLEDALAFALAEVGADVAAPWSPDRATTG